MYGVTIRCPGAPSPDTLGPMLEALTEANASWYLEQWSAGRRPPTRCADAGVVYRPHAMSDHPTWHGATDILRKPRRGWSCQECAALEAGAMRAAMIWNGAHPAEARAACRCVLSHDDVLEWHAIVHSPSGPIDPTEELRT